MPPRLFASRLAYISDYLVKFELLLQAKQNIFSVICLGKYIDLVENSVYILSFSKKDYENDWMVLKHKK